MKSIIFEDDNIKCIFFPGDHSTKQIIITFGDAVNLDNVENNFFAEKIFIEKNIPSIGIMAKSQNWYPRESIDLFAAINSSLLDKYIDKIGYGASMGAYCAIRSSSLLNLSSTIAMAPQWSINQNECDFDAGWFQTYYKDSMGLMGIKPKEMSGNIFIFFDQHGNDLHHANKIKNLFSKTYLIKMAYSGHSPVLVLKGSENFFKLLNYVCALDIFGINLHVQSLRRKSLFIKYNLLNKASKRKPILASKIIMSRIGTDHIYNNLYNAHFKEIAVSLSRSLINLTLLESWIKGAYALNIDLKQKILNDLILGKGRNRYIQAHTKKFLFYDLVSQKILQAFVGAPLTQIPILSYVDEDHIRLYINYFKYPIYLTVTAENNFDICLDEADISKLNLIELSPNKFAIKFNEKFLSASDDDSEVVSLGPSKPHAWETFNFLDQDLAKLWN